ncbi:hypothetical protein [Bradyrhizobium genosp. P]|uniref:hypothetical protein n=1 Tax=Bradyrhizobium genosp. P TaxID=83641 RepID=UPI003CF83BC4
MTDNDIADLLTEQANTLQQVASILQRVAAMPPRHPHPGDWVDAGDADMLSSDEAGFVIGKSADTAVRWFEAAATEGFPLGIRRGGICLFSLRRLLEWVERNKGLPSRLACETRAKKSAEMRLARQKRDQIAQDAAATAQ